MIPKEAQGCSWATRDSFTQHPEVEKQENHMLTIHGLIHERNIFLIHDLSCLFLSLSYKDCPFNAPKVYFLAKTKHSAAKSQLLQFQHNLNNIISTKKCQTQKCQTLHRYLCSILVLGAAHSISTVSAVPLVDTSVRIIWTWTSKGTGCSDGLTGLRIVQGEGRDSLI
jgi:hypothetical protein